MRTKIILHAMFATAIALTLGCNRSEPAKEQSDWDALRAEVSSLRKCLAQDGAYAFVTNASTPKLAPHIHSQYWLMMLPAESITVRQYEQEKRNFGLDMLGQLERYAKQRANINDIATLQQRTQELLAISDWLKTAPGYGNFILKRWAEDMASTTISKLAVNNNFPVSEAKSLLQRIDQPYKNAEIQIAILNEESPNHYNLPRGSTPECIVREIGQQWATHKASAVQTFKKKFTMRTPPHFSDAFAHDPQLAFYMRSNNRTNASLRSLWNDNDHEETCVYGMFCQVPHKVEQILKFREIAGEIPSPTESDLSSTEQQELFVDRLNDIWLSKCRGQVSKPVGRLVLWVYMGMLNDNYSRAL